MDYLLEDRFLIHLLAASKIAEWEFLVQIPMPALILLVISYNVLCYNLSLAAHLHLKVRSNALLYRTLIISRMT